MLSVEISTISRRAERTRKVHHHLYAPSFEAADRITADLAKIGNLASGWGRCSRDLMPSSVPRAVAVGPLLVVAGPGAGKTRTLTDRIAHQILTHGIPAGRFLTITFTRRAANEMRHRLAALGLGQDSLGQDGEVTVTTF